MGGATVEGNGVGAVTGTRRGVRWLVSMVIGESNGVSASTSSSSSVSISITMASSEHTLFGGGTVLVSGVITSRGGMSSTLGDGAFVSDEVAGKIGTLGSSSNMVFHTGSRRASS